MPENNTNTVEKEKTEITLKFGKGLVRPFSGKDGTEWAKILIPNDKPEDHTPWMFFVVKAKQVHPNQYGKGMWLKLPADGNTMVTGYVAKEGVTTKDGRQAYTEEKLKVSNRNLKEIVESYKTRGEKEKEKAAPERSAQSRGGR